MRGLTYLKHFKYHLHKLRECGETRTKDLGTAAQFQKDLELLEIEHTLERQGNEWIFTIKEG